MPEWVWIIVLVILGTLDLSISKLALGRVALSVGVVSIQDVQVWWNPL